MKHSISYGLLFMLFSVLVYGQEHVGGLPRAGAVPDEATAIRIAEAVLLPVYGEEHINKERPLHARLQKGTWTVYSTLTLNGSGESILVRIRQMDGEIAFIKYAGSRLPQAGAVPDEATAIRIAEAVLLPVYGEEHINKERPLHARLQKGTWTVYGTLPPNARGGTVMVKMRKRDGKILNIYHSV